MVRQQLDVDDWDEGKGSRAVGFFRSIYNMLKKAYNRRQKKSKEEKRIYRAHYEDAKLVGLAERANREGYQAGLTKPVSLGAKIGKELKEAEGFMDSTFGKADKNSDPFGIADFMAKPEKAKKKQSMEGEEWWNL